MQPSPIAETASPLRPSSRDFTPRSLQPAARRPRPSRYRRAEGSDGPAPEDGRDGRDMSQERESGDEFQAAHAEGLQIGLPYDYRQRVEAPESPIRGSRHHRRGLDEELG